MSTSPPNQPTHTPVLKIMRLLADVAALKSYPPAQRQMLVEGLSSMVSTNEAFPYVSDGCSEDGSPTFNVRTSTADQDPLVSNLGSV